MATNEGSCVVRGGLALTLRVSRFLGIAPIWLMRADEDNWRIFICTPFVTYGYFVLLLLITSYLGIVYHIYQEIQNTPKDAAGVPNNVLAEGVEALAIVSAVTEAVRGASARMESVIKCFNVIEKAPIPRRQSNEMRLKEDGKGSMMSILVMLVACAHVLAYMLVYYTVPVTHGGFLKRVYLGFVGHIIVIIVLELQFVQVSQVIVAEFTNINDSLLRLAKSTELEDKTVKPVFEGIFRSNKVITTTINNVIDTLAVHERKEQNMKSVEDQVRQHSRYISVLSGLVSNISRSYGKFLLLSLGVIFYILVLTPFYMVFVLTDIPIESSFRLLFICMTSILRLVMISETGHQITVEFNRARIILGEWISKVGCYHGGLAFELDLLFMQIETNKVAYTPFGICKLRRALVLTLFSAATTYMIVLLQFV